MSGDTIKIVIYLVAGENAYEADRKVRELAAGFSGTVEKFDGSTMTLEELAGVMAGGSLFAQQRFVVVRGLAANKAAWNKLGEWAEGLANEDLTLVVMEPTVDKRTKTYKTLAKHATVVAAEPWTDRHMRDAEAWADRLAQQMGVVLPPGLLAQVCTRAIVLNTAGKPVIDQYLIYRALTTLQGAGKVSQDQIDTVLPPDSYANVFELLTLALRGNHEEMRSMLSRLRRSDDAYKIIGLVSSQWVQFVVLSATKKPPADVARDLGVHPFAIQKLAAYRGSVGAGQVVRLTGLLADLDARLKSSSLDPWVALDRFLHQLASDVRE